jgi:hypothetical protein
MSEEEKYDELIRQKFAEQEFMFNEANWEKAEATIDASRKTKKIFWWSSFFLIGLITGIFLMLPLINNNSSHTTTEKAKLNDRMVTDSQAKGSPSDEAAGKSATGNTEANSHENDLKAQNKSAVSASGDQSQKNKFSKDLVKAIDSKTAQHPSENNATLKSSKSKATEVNADPSQNIPETSGLLTLQKKKKENKASENEKNVFAIAHERNVIKNAIPHTAKKDDKTSETKEKPITEGNENREAEKSEFAEKETPSADPADSAFSGNTLAAETAAKIDALNDSTKQEEKKLVADSVQKSDSVKLAAQEKTIMPALDGIASATFLSVDAGINGQLGWKYKEVIEGRGITPVLGLGITHAFNQTWSFSSGVQYNGIWYLKPDTKTAKTTIYDFGSTTTIITTKPGFLHYIAVPLTIQYHFNDKNAILAGGSFSYLLNAKSKVEENIIRVGPALATGTISADNSSNSDYYRKTVNPFDAVIGIGYRRKISTHFSITGIANFGLLDVKQNSYFLKNTFERNNGLRAILSYTIFDF